MKITVDFNIAILTIVYFVAPAMGVTVLIKANGIAPRTIPDIAIIYKS